MTEDYRQSLLDNLVYLRGKQLIAALMTLLRAEPTSIYYLHETKGKAGRAVEADCESVQ
jgi:hypothetical protein